MGSFHQCLGIKQETGVESIEGKYCMIRTIIHDTMALPRLYGQSSTDVMDWIEMNINTTVKAMNGYRHTVRLNRDLGDQMKRYIKIEVMTGNT